MGMYAISCPTCKKMHTWFSGITDQRCSECKAPVTSPQWRRLRSIQDRLTARGVKDIQIAWSPGVTVGQFTLDQMAEDLATALEAYLDGRFHILPPSHEPQDSHQ